MTSWDILIATIPQRNLLLRALLAELGAQWQPGVGVIAYQDNYDHTIAEKRQALLEASRADYVCFIDDDDMIAPCYVPMIMVALGEGPDYVGFKVRYLVDGDDQSMPAEHSLRYGGWRADNTGMFRDISHLNPVRRQLALLGTFSGGYSEDSRWAAQLRASGQVREEVFIGTELYWYQYSSKTNAGTAKYRPARGPLPELPSYPWLVTL